ncbi:MAG: EAL domain-containing protein [Solirubrobacteraceae bacterium]
MLKQLGVQIAVDDFGTGLSSLSQLPRLPVDILKIDQSFVQKLNTSAESLTLIRTLIELGRSLRLKTVAEGIEDRAALEALRSFGCDYGQGFLLSRPLSSEALVHLLDARPGAPTRGHRTNGISHAEEALRAP